MEETLRALHEKEGKDKLFEQLVISYKEQIYWHVRRIVIDHQDADDVVQNAFIKIWRNLDTFKWESKIYTWMYRIATNESLNFIEKRKRNLNESLDNALIHVAGSPSGFNGDEIQLKLQRAILTLPEKQRLVFNMKYFDDKKYEEMSAILDTSVGALKASYHHAVAKIKKF